MRKTYFISDLHLSDDRSDITEAFFTFVDEHMSPDVDALYILGDFFEVWIGDDERAPLANMVAEKLNGLKELNIDVYFLHGNRDFLIGKRYAKQANFHLLPEQAVIDLYGNKTVILHGDEMCTQDIAYQNFRKKSRGWWWPKLILATPLWYRRRVAKKARQKSKENQKGKSLDILDVTSEAVQAMFEKYHVYNMIHGHTHRPYVHTSQKDDKEFTRTVLGDWYSQSSYLVVNELGQTLTSHTLAK
ncbi:UDP-2,3-diacylglucosamine hydrolase [Pseudoalteromonas citrea]|uniref:UDP-2,3-diacylglucosamine hydrolase n=2 Tax=Pseudoalteromonas citrea TaxID=43655 RepID=A0AAD4FTL0_9GAMM|nr:UDP-2,3-diacylglucosamine diphosphatase [Pseudoalteromonas citrea]KAF7775107.1 UDP-2,3-diacylglucosamine hydrolase [Pseudoalteromonas citrea]